MKDALPDVNVLLALAWPNHQFFDRARQWFMEHSATWCTCAVTQLGFVRLSSNPAFTEHARTPLEAAGLLAEMTRHPQHRVLDNHPRLDGEPFIGIAPRLMGHQQVTDGYLLVLAQQHDVQIVTFDRRIQALNPYNGLVLRLEG